MEVIPLCDIKVYIFTSDKTIIHHSKYYKLILLICSTYCCELLFVPDVNIYTLPLLIIYKHQKIKTHRALMIEFNDVFLRYKGCEIPIKFKNTVK